MGFRANQIAKAEERTARMNADHAVKATDNLRKRRDWIVTKMALNVSLTGQAFDNDLSRLAQELFYIDAALDALAKVPAPPEADA